MKACIRKRVHISRLTVEDIQNSIKAWCRKNGIRYRDFARKVREARAQAR